MWSIKLWKQALLIFGIPALFLLGGIFVLASENQPDERPIGYELLDGNKVVHTWNEEDDYYFNASSGIQMTNHYNEYWTHNTFCGGFKINGEWKYYCNDELPFDWSIETNNETYVNITGYKDVTKTVEGKNYSVRFALRYHLKNNDTNMTIIPYAKNIGSNNIPVDMGFAWRMNDIKINNDTENDVFMVWNGTNYWNDETRNGDWEAYYLNQTLDLSYTDLNESFMYIYDATGEHIWMSWEDNINYKLTVENKTGQINAPITFMINAGTLNIGQEKSTKILWIDDLCTYSCTTVTPASDPNIGEGESFGMSARWNGIGTKCVSSASVYALFNNGTTQNIGSTGQLYISAGDTNPVSKGNGVTASWTITGNETGTYSVQGKCIVAFANYYGSSTTVTVNPAPPEALCSNEIHITTNTTLGSDYNNNSCFFIDSENTYLDCNNHILTGNNSGAYWGIEVEGSDNVIIKNCFLQQFGHNIYLNGSDNSLLWNNTIYNGTHLNATIVNTRGINLLNSNNVILNNTNITGLSGNSTFSGDCYDGDLYGLFINNSNNVSINGLCSHNLMGQYSGDSDTDTAGCQQGFINIGDGIEIDYSNNISFNMGCVENTLTNGIIIFGSYNLNFNYFNISNVFNGISSSSSDNISYTNGLMHDFSNAISSANAKYNISYNYFTNGSDGIILTGNSNFENNLIENLSGSYLEITGNSLINNNLFKNGENVHSKPIIKVTSTGSSNFTNDTFLNFNVTGTTGGSNNAVIHSSDPINVFDCNFTNVSDAITFHNEADNSQIWNTYIDAYECDLMNALSDNVQLYNVSYNKSAGCFYLDDYGFYRYFNQIRGYVYNISGGTLTEVLTYQEGDGKGSVSDYNDTGNNGMRSGVNDDGTTDTTRLHQLPIKSGITFGNLFGSDTYQIPLGSTINNATLRFTLSSTDGDNYVIAVSQINDPNGDGFPDFENADLEKWTNRYGATAWATAGGDYYTDTEVSFAIPNTASAGDNFTIDITGIVQNWSDGEINQGLIMRITSGSGGFYLRTSNYASESNRPLLTVNYTTGSEVPIPIEGVNVSVYDNRSILKWTNLTDADGYTPYIWTEEFNQTGEASYVDGCTGSSAKITCLTPHNMTATKTGYDMNWTNFTANQLKTIQILLALSTGGDTCTCAGLNTNWEIDLSDNCNITSDCNLGYGNLTFINTTILNQVLFNATITVNKLTFKDKMGVNEKYNLGSSCKLLVGQT